MSRSYEKVKAMSQPVPPDPSRGHQKHMASWRVVDGGVVVYRYQSMCKCYWTQPFASATLQAANAAYEEHLS